jgi:hypothetical protein
MHILINTREIRNPCAIRPKQIDTIIAGFDHTKRHRRCTDANLPSFVLLNGVIGAAFAPTLAPTLALVLLGKGEDTDVDVDRSSIGGRRSLSISDFRLWTTPCNRPSPQMRSLEKGGREGGEEEEDTHASSNDLMAFLMPSAPSASVPYGSLDEPDILLSSDTRSDSSLYNEGGEAKKARRGQVSGTVR